MSPTHQTTCHFPGIGFIEAIGPEARTWLQNLSTNDVRPLAPGDGCEAFFTNHKARTIAHAVLHCVRDDAFLLAVESQRAEALFKHLNHFLISEQVELAMPDWSLMRVLGPDAERWAADATKHSLAGFKPWQFATVGEGMFVRRQAALSPQGFDLFGPRDWIATVRQGLPSVFEDDVEPMRIESGWPRWGREMDENRFVVELGRTATAISYAKGCYLGQEPIVMARDRGQVNRHLLGFKADTEVPIGTSVMKGEVEQFRVTSSAFSTELASFVGLAYAYRGTGSAGTTISLPGGGSALLCSLPMMPG